MSPALISSILNFLIEALPTVESIVAAVQNDLGLFTKAKSLIPFLEDLTTSLKAASSPTAAPNEDK